MDQEHPPLGARQLYYDTGTWPYLNLGSWEVVTSTYCIPEVFGAMLRSGCQLDTLDFCGVPQHLPFAKTATSRKLSRTSTPAKTFAQSHFAELKLSKLHHLSLSLSKWRELPLPNTQHVSTGRPLHWFASLVPYLTSLRTLCLTSTEQHNTGESLIHSLVSTESSPSQLRSLEIRGLGFNLEELTQLLLRNRLTLRSFVCQDARTPDSLQQLSCLLLDLPLLVNAGLSTNRWIRDADIEYIIHERTPEDFRSRLTAILADFGLL